ncbi:cell division protein FtsQ/DivIB [Zhihengliuella halotolerans]|uniref:cell division protein FtsQ/DivIB n=1 Tax=Zhihengliuella halotolerans TaxID=370736 RepID=UPI000C8028EA|nr:cell division protein FtsQ/DivIB [Zhihengliuella halotolerans]
MGAEHNVVELPPQPGRVWKKRLLVGGSATLAVVLVLIGVLLYSPLLAIERVEISGNELARSERLAEDLRALEGVPLPRVGPGTVLELLQDQRAVEDVVIQAEAPDTLHVIVTEYQPVAMTGRKGAYKLVAADGRYLKTVENRGDFDLPLISGVSSSSKPELFETITSVLSSLPEEVLAQLKYATAKTIDSVELELTTGERVRWGSAENNVEKASVLTALLGIEPPKNQPAVKVYDVSSPERPVTR